MATARDLDLAKRLMRAGVIDEERLRRALAVQEQNWRQERKVTLEQVLYHLGDVPKGSLAILRGPGPLQGQPFANYRLDRELGEGGLATVYAGIYTPNGTPVAVKVLDPVHALRDVHRDRFHHEAKLHIELEHENLVAGYEVGFQGGYHFYTMDLVDGATVLQVVERRGHLTNQEALSITLQAARALAYLHGRGLLHRDVKPGNIMVDAYGHARILDLGLVGSVHDGGAVAAAGAMTVGTVEYLSPEQARGQSDLDARADIYSLGMTLYHMVVGEVAFQGETSYEVMAQQVLATMDAQKIKKREIDPQTYFLIAKMTAKDRAERWSEVGEVIQFIEAYLPEGIVAVDLGDEGDGAAVDDDAPPPVVEPIAPRRGRRLRRDREDDGGPAPRRGPRRRFR